MSDSQEVEYKAVQQNTIEYSKLSDKDALEGFNLLVSNNPIESVVENLYQIYRNNPAALAKRIYRSAIMQCNKGEIKTVAVYYPRIYNGGVERGISYQLPMFLSLGFRVVLITDEIKEEVEYKIPDSVVRVVIPAAYRDGRTFVLSEAIKKHKIDTILYHAASSQRFLFDLILVKALGCNLIAFLHELSTQTLVLSLSDFGARPHLYRLADALVVMSHMEENFYKHFNVPAYYIPNSIVIDVDRTERDKKEEKAKSVLWIGRLDPNQKNYREALDIFKQVTQEVPNVTCYMVGDNRPGDSEYVKAYIERNGLGDRIKYVGFTSDVGRYYSLADVHLVTSNYESYCRVLAESKAYGIPAVLYEMPYLEILKDRKGYIPVARHDKKAACAAIIDLLTDDTKRINLGIEARQSILDFVEKSGDQSLYWKNLLSELSQGKPRKENRTEICEEQLDLNLLFWDASVSFLQEGLNRKGKDLNKLKLEKEAISQEKETLQKQKGELSQQKETLLREKKNLLQQKETLSREKEELSRQKETLSQEKEQLEHKNKQLKQAELATEKKLAACMSRELALKNSLSFRIGRSITWLPRKLRGSRK